MSNLKQLKTYATDKFTNDFKALCKKHNLKQSDFIADAITEKAQRDYGVDLGVASAPHGVRSDALPDGWKSRLYRDRYQVVAQWNAKQGFVLYHQHEFKEVLDGRIFDTLTADTPEPVEITVIDLPEEHHNERDEISIELRLAYMEWLNHA